MTTHDENEYKTLKDTLADLGPIRRGTILRRFVKCGSKGCRCHGSPPQLHGPYYEWSRKVKGKTVTVRATKEQAQLLEQWIANSRRLDEIVAQMQLISERITEPLFQAAKKPAKRK